MTRLEDLIAQIRSDQVYRGQVEESLEIMVYTKTDKPDQSTMELNGGFVYSLLLIDVLLRMNFNQEDKKQLLQRCYDEYRNNHRELSVVEEFDRTYSSNRALWWYTRDSFIHKMLNKALRKQDIELLFLFRFLIRDIYEQLKRYQCPSPIRVYRGQVMSKNEIQRLQQSMGQLISVNSFFSTSMDDRKAVAFLNGSSISRELLPVLFIIDADPRVVTTKPFADVRGHSPYDESEILFMIGCVFRIVDIRQQNRMWTIFMSLCSDYEHDKNDLLRRLKRECGGGNQQVDQKSFGAVLHKMGKYNFAQMVYFSALNDSTIDGSTYASICRSLGMISEDKGDYDISLKWYDHAWLTQLRHDPSDYVSLGSIYCCIGVVYKKKGDYNKALEYYNKAIDLFRREHAENHPNMASFYNNIAIICNSQKQYSKALDFYKKVLEIERKHLPADHADLGMSYNNIGLVYYSLGNYDLAMKYYRKSLEIKLKSLPSDHPLIAKSYVNMGRVYEAKNDKQQALTYFQKAADIRCKALASDHPDVIRIKEDIRRLQSNR